MALLMLVARSKHQSFIRRLRAHAAEKKGVGSGVADGWWLHRRRKPHIAED
jgi:hypothetical protein